MDGGINTLNTNNEPSKFSTSPHFIAYLDILGYKEKVIKDGGVKLAKTIDSTLDSAVDFAKWFLGHSDDVVLDSDIKIKAFSDNILICTEKRWDLLFLMAGFLQHRMIGDGCFIRGALCHSELYFDERFLFGKGIIMAHEIESRIARFPRIILHSSFKKAVSDTERDDIIFDAFTCVAGMLPLYLHDSDGYMFLNYLQMPHEAQESLDKINLADMLAAHRDRVKYNVKDCEERYLSKDLMGKFLWCAQYHNHFCNKNGYENYVI